MTGRFLLAPGGRARDAGRHRHSHRWPRGGLARHNGPAVAAPPLTAPIDPQRWQDQQEMTWNDYRPIPGENWADPSRSRNAPCAWRWWPSTSPTSRS